MSPGWCGIGGGVGLAGVGWFWWVAGGRVPRALVGTALGGAGRPGVVESRWWVASRAVGDPQRGYPPEGVWDMSTSGSVIRPIPAPAGGRSSLAGYYRGPLCAAIPLWGVPCLLSGPGCGVYGCWGTRRTPCWGSSSTSVCWGPRLGVWVDGVGARGRGGRGVVSGVGAGDLRFVLIDGPGVVGVRHDGGVACRGVGSNQYKTRVGPTGGLGPAADLMSQAQGLNIEQRRVIAVNPSTPPETLAQLLTDAAAGSASQG